MPRAGGFQTMYHPDKGAIVGYAPHLIVPIGAFKHLTTTVS